MSSKEYGFARGFSERVDRRGRMREREGRCRDLQTNKYQSEVITRVRGWKAVAKVKLSPAVWELRKDV
jgi:hypothetical protein